MTTTTTTTDQEQDQGLVIKALNHDGKCQVFLGVFDHTAVKWIPRGDNRIDIGMANNDEYACEYHCLHCYTRYDSRYFQIQHHTCYKNDLDCGDGCKAEGKYHRFTTNKERRIAQGHDDHKTEAVIELTTQGKLDRLETLISGVTDQGKLDVMRDRFDELISQRRYELEEGRA